MVHTPPRHTFTRTAVNSDRMDLLLMHVKLSAEGTEVTEDAGQHQHGGTETHGLGFNAGFERRRHRRHRAVAPRFAR